MNFKLILHFQSLIFSIYCVSSHASALPFVAVHIENELVTNARQNGQNSTLLYQAK